MRILAWLLLSAAAACSFDQSGVTGGGSGTDAPPGTIDAMIDAPVDATPCGSCSGDTLLGCQGQPDQQCALGCSMAGGAHCKQLVPSNGVPVSALSGVTSGLTTQPPAMAAALAHDYTINTDTGEILDWGAAGYPASTTQTTVRSPGVGVVAGIGFSMDGDIAVLAVTSLDVSANTRVVGLGAHALAILAKGDVTIEGEIVFAGGCADPKSATDSCAGPGGGTGAVGLTAASGCGVGGLGAMMHFTGGGGGGGGTAGAAGGDFQGVGGGGGTVKGGAAGKACLDATLVPLVGGSGGGAGGNGMGGDGGGGGGALQITSLTAITLDHPLGATASDINAGGAGGGGTATTFQGGGGGGAGGGILLEALTLAVHTSLAANGGGGGGGRVVGQDGNPGGVTNSQATGGPGDGIGSLTGAGGLGGAFSGNAGQGIGGADGTGGGGGGTGRIRLNSQSGNADIQIGTTVSPSASQGKVTIQ